MGLWRWHHKNTVGYVSQSFARFRLVRFPVPGRRSVQIEASVTRSLPLSTSVLWSFFGWLIHSFLQQELKLRSRQKNPSIDNKSIATMTHPGLSRFPLQILVLVDLLLPTMSCHALHPLTTAFVSPCWKEQEGHGRPRRSLLRTWCRNRYSYTNRR